MEVIVIAAVADNGVIGADGGMPWHHPEDLRHFRETTTGHPVVLGRTTYESIVERLGGPLPDRTNVVLTNRELDASVDVASDASEGSEERSSSGVVANEGSEGSEDRSSSGVVAASSVDEALAVARETGADAVYVAGGATVYEQFLPLADRMVVTEIHERPDGDVHFPEWGDEEWVETARDDREVLSFVEYERR